jgi:cell division septum initiation protein DivIVA
VEVHAKLDALTRLVEEARAMPLSASCVVNRQEVLELLDDVRAQLPDELTAASALLEDRQAVLTEAEVEAADVLAAARAESERLVSQTEVLITAQARAEELLAATDAECERRQRETDEYIDARLAQFEVALERTMETVTRGRNRLAVRGGWEGDEDLGEDPLPQH